MSVLAAPVRLRRTQEERRSSTRASLLDATVACLHERGYANTTTTEIARRAGVSRGAQLHHFPTKAELVTTAVEYLFDRRVEEFRAAFARLPADANRPVAGIELLWKILSGPSFYAWLELMVAARTDDELRPTVAAIAKRFAEAVRQTFVELFPRAPDRPHLDATPAFTFAVLQGLALEHMLTHDEDRVEGVLEILRALGTLVLARP